MSVTGIVTNGVVVLPPGSTLVDGVEVTVEPIKVAPESDPFLAVIGNIARPRPDWPDDLAANHDYYLHGHDRKQQPRGARWIPSDLPTPVLTAEEAAEEANQLAMLAAETTGLPDEFSHDPTESPRRRPMCP